MEVKNVSWTGSKMLNAKGLVYQIPSNARRINLSIFRQSNTVSLSLSINVLTCGIIKL